MKTIAAILVETGKPLVIDDLEIPRLQPGQALVEIHASGVCHTQLLEAKGLRGEDKFLPHCLGHEGSGVVKEIGAGVTKVKPEQKVILSWIKGSGINVLGTQYEWHGRKVNAGAITTFSRYAVISENRLTPLPDGIDMAQAALLGCAVPTGVGSVWNTAGARPGNSFVIFGVGGVGLSAVAGAVLAGCSPVIAVDLVAERLELARQLGATHTVDPKTGDAVQQILKICAGGVDIALEATGRPAVMKQAVACVRSQGGVAVIIGNSPEGEMLALDPKQLNQGKQLRGTWGGDNVPDRDYPRYCELLRAGKLNVKPIVSRSFPLEQVNQALASLEHGAVGRPIIGMI
jgi:S-(hydroxymethyl)glutathione dehydrogenase / alcohol dehydrogenase